MLLDMTAMTPLVPRLHVDLGRLASAACRRRMA
ncbi:MULTISPECIES: putative leader peptide [unclassified Streptomyces]|nr:putative leader peptide [Streptomyces sp. NBC_01381]